MGEPARLQLPVFLPGSTQDWDEVAGLATITEEGEINIKLYNAGAAVELVKLHQAGRLFSLSFAYEIKKD